MKTQHHNKFAEFLIQSPVHIFATARGKDKWITEDKNGKMAPKKVGEGSVASDDTEYNYTCTFNLSQDTHIASCSKDNTHIFEGRFDVLTEKDGEKLYEWANTGVVQKESIGEIKKAETANDDSCENTNVITTNDILTVFKKRSDEGISKDELYGVVQSVAHRKNFMNIKDDKLIGKVYNAVRDYQPE